MKKTLPIVAIAAMLAAAVTPTQVQARDGAVVGGVLGGLAVGAIVGSAIAQPRPYYYEPVYEPAPVYVVPERRTCVEEREVWSNRYQQYVVRSVRVPCY
jgi:hypothetical protein